ncbi:MULTISPECIES: type II toxin-antitoxin system HicA family toxin [Mesorhizobium]|uniref:Type II toxin-antitoxin system HicA family toxin n=1 Tax=Mesorhizobium huakuii TaxID=28104 RepID=A0A7G6SRW7_9HYPH|nr:MULTISPECIES: type II toxin-antitoxin system HicA family toxin [Mesorhizobium]QND57249.1 type II toxin-antitoxin system HicA family toxin [Mesorhizobium huakuii]
MPLIETNTRKIVTRLLRDGWLSVGGGKHDKYEHSDRPEVIIIVPRHREQSPGVARSIARLAGWI